MANIESLKNFINVSIDEYTKDAGFYPSKIEMATDLFTDFYKEFGMHYSMSYSSSQHVLYRGIYIYEDKLLTNTCIKVAGVLIKKFTDNGEYHTCESNKTKYIGFTDVFEFCSVCNKKL